MAASAVVPDREDLAIDQTAVVESLAIAPVVPADTDSPSFVREERVEPGDTFAHLLERLGADDAQSFEFLRTSREAQPMFRQLRAGKTVTARTTGDGRLLSLSFPLNNRDGVLVIERDGDRLNVAQRSLQFDTRVLMASGEIRSSLFGATDAIGLPDAVTMQLAEIFSADIDFHRDLRRGDRFALVYEMQYAQGLAVRSGRILAAEFTNQGKTYRAFSYRTPDGRDGYYGADGKSLRRAFLRSPLEFSRITSGFAMRFHPVLQKWRAHNGVDYGAATGARVKASGDGVIEFAGRQGGYGNVVIIRHAKPYSTLYAHLNGFAPGIRRGVRVGQGDVIGYVGATGLATGPHLHYEFRVNGQFRNPLAAVLPAAIPLEQRELAAFRERIDPLALRLNLIRTGDLASLN